MFGILPFSFRFRGKVRRLFEMYLCFLENDGKALHPTQLSRQTGIRFADVAGLLDHTPELFVKLPKRRDGITRYRLTSVSSTLSPEDVQLMLNRNARRESLILYSIALMILCIFVIAVIIISPTLGA